LTESIGRAPVTGSTPSRSSETIRGIAGASVCQKTAALAANALAKTRKPVTIIIAYIPLSRRERFQG